VQACECLALLPERRVVVSVNKYCRLDLSERVSLRCEALHIGEGDGALLSCTVGCAILEIRPRRRACYAHSTHVPL
jgi:hypothetical protein